MTNCHRLRCLLALLLGATSAPLFAVGPAEQSTRAAIARVQRIDPSIHAVLAIEPTAIAQARTIDAGGVRGPLVGQPVLIKDNIEVAGLLPTTAGSLALIDNVTGRDAPLIARLRQAGAVILGKTNLSEWANIRSTNSISGWSAVGGQTRNPHALDRDPCGSSSGSGAAVAAGIVDLAIGTETDGSITCPAALNGIVGFKPTVGLVSRTHIVPISTSQDTAGPMTRTVLQAAQLLSAIAGTDPADPATKNADAHRADYAAGLTADALHGMRIGVMRFASGFGTDGPFEAALAVLRAQGATLVEIKAFDDKAIGPGEHVVLMTEFKAGLNAYLATTPPQVVTRTLAAVIAFNTAHAVQELSLFGQDTFIEADKSTGLDDPTYLKARATSLAAAGVNGIDRLLKADRLDALVGPTMPPAWKIDAVNGDQSAGGGAGSLAAVAGYPHLTVPMGAVKGLPVGLSFIGAKWDDAKILSLGYAYEQASHALVAPRFVPSIEQVPPVAQMLMPQR
ncbi:amidase [Sphingomonas sp.]|uniref:amidase n=1 Tax=Sphingomonas sp. TaxID=28214 RepID=UPI002869F348|nr:amidase [Sphingomonas sp.]